MVIGSYLVIRVLIVNQISFEFYSSFHFALISQNYMPFAFNELTPLNHSEDHLLGLTSQWSRKSSLIPSSALKQKKKNFISFIPEKRSFHVEDSLKSMWMAGERFESLQKVVLISHKKRDSIILLHWETGKLILLTALNQNQFSNRSKGLFSCKQHAPRSRTKHESHSKQQA